MADNTFKDGFLRFLDGAVSQQKRLAGRAIVQFVTLRLTMVGRERLGPALA